MSRYQRLTTCFIGLWLCVCTRTTLLADERQERIAAGNQFLNKSRIDRWEKYFSEGLPQMGKIIVKSNGKVVKESWFEKEHMLMRVKLSEDKALMIFSNPNYLASVKSRKGENRIDSVSGSVANSELVYVDGVPFAICSSVNFTRELIPRYLQQDKLRISEYRHENQKHYVELEFVDDSLKGQMELIFRDDNPSLLPDESIFKKGTPYPRHFINTDFVEVLGYHIPLRIDDKNSKDGSITEIIPEDRLNKEMCQLSHYGLPEPGKMVVTDFGRNRYSWPTSLLVILVIVALGSGGFLWLRKKKSS